MLDRYVILVVPQVLVLNAPQFGDRVDLQPGEF
jgi:hypothetical protein